MSNLCASSYYTHYSTSNVARFANKHKRIFCILPFQWTFFALFDKEEKKRKTPTQGMDDWRFESFIWCLMVRCGIGFFFFCSSCSCHLIVVNSWIRRTFVFVHISFTFPLDILLPIWVLNFFFLHDKKSNEKSILVWNKNSRWLKGAIMTILWQINRNRFFMHTQIAETLLALILRLFFSVFFFLALFSTPCMVLTPACYIQTISIYDVRQTNDWYDIVDPFMVICIRNHYSTNDS